MIRQMKLAGHKIKACKDAADAIMSCVDWEDTAPPPADWQKLYFRLRRMQSFGTNDGEPIHPRRPARMPEDYGKAVLVRDCDGEDWTEARLGGYAAGSAWPYMDTDGCTWKLCEIANEVSE
jgi:hypothetical protein